MANKGLPPMDPILMVGIKTGNILWDSTGTDLGHVYDHACYDAELNRRNRQRDIINMPIIGHRNGVEKRVVDERYVQGEHCESCFQKHHTIVDLKVKRGEIYCPHCEVRRPLK